MIGTALILLSARLLQPSDGPRLQDLPGKHATARTVVLDTEVACTPAQSYAMWSTDAGARFFAPASHIDPHAGGRYTVMFFPAEDPDGLVHGTAGAHLLAADPGRFIAFEWIVFAGANNKGDNAPPYAPAAQRLPDPLPTWVEIGFAPTATGTHVAFRHYGFDEGDLWGRSHAWFSRAWGGVLQAMKAACAG